MNKTQCKYNNRIDITPERLGGFSMAEIIIVET